MPTYDYVCEACGYEFEHFQSMTSSILKKCPECGKMKLRRLIGSGAGIIFKGSGFYETDYRSDNYKSAAKQANTEKTKPCKSCENKEKCTETKQETKQETGKNSNSDKKTA